MLERILNLFWPLLSAAAAVFFTPVTLVALLFGEFKIAATGAAILVIPYFILLSVFLEHLIRKKFDLSVSQLAQLAYEKPMYSANIWRYGSSRRRLLTQLLEEPNSIAEVSVLRFRWLIALHVTLAWLFALEMVAFVAALIVECVRE